MLQATMKLRKEVRRMKKTWQNAKLIMFVRGTPSENILQTSQAESPLNNPDTLNKTYRVNGMFYSPRKEVLNKA